MEVEEITIDDSQPAVNGGNGGSYRNENISIVTSATQTGIMKGSSRQNRVVLDSSPRPYSTLLKSLLQKDKSAPVNAECGSGGQDISILKTPRKENIQQLESVLQEGSVGNLSSSAKCSICGQLFLNFGELMRHLMSHFKQPGDGASVSTTTTAAATTTTTTTTVAADRYNELICLICKKSFKNRYSLVRHIKYVHEGNSPANLRECSYCGIAFRYTQLKRHIIEFHLVVENNFYHCLVCLAVFGTLNGSVRDVKKTLDPHSILSSSSNSTQVNQPEKLVDPQGSSQALLTCVDCGSNQVHKVRYKSNKYNLLRFDCCVCNQVDFKACFVKLTCKSEVQNRRHNSACGFCKLKNDEKNRKEFDQKSRQDQALGQSTSNVDVIELSDEDEAHTSDSGDKSIIMCTDNENVCNTTCRESSSIPKEDRNECNTSVKSYSGNNSIIVCTDNENMCNTTCRESSSIPKEDRNECNMSVKSEIPCNEDEVEIIEEHITDVSREQSLALKDIEDYITKVEKDCRAQFGTEIIDLL